METVTGIKIRNMETFNKVKRYVKLGKTGSISNKKSPWKRSLPSEIRGDDPPSMFNYTIPISTTSLGTKEGINKELSTKKAPLLLDDLPIIETPNTARQKIMKNTN